MDLRISIEGVDITDDVSVQDCVIDRSLSTIADNATIVCNDVEGRWGDWGLRVGARLDLSDGDRAILRGWVTSWSVASGIASIEATTAAPAAQSTHSATLDGSLDDCIRAVCRMDGMDAKFSGDFSPSLHGFWMANRSVGDVLRSLAEQYDFEFIASVDGFRFVAADSLKKQAEIRLVTILEDDSYAFSDGQKWSRIRVTNGKASGEATRGEGDKVATIIHAGDATDAELQDIARRILARRNRSDSMSLSRSTDGGIWTPGEVMEVTAPDAHHSGRYLLRSVRVHASRGVQTFKGVRLV